MLGFVALFEDLALEQRVLARCVRFDWQWHLLAFYILTGEGIDFLFIYLFAKKKKKKMVFYREQWCY